MTGESGVGFLLSYYSIIIFGFVGPFQLSLKSGANLNWISIVVTPAE
jgi:hypothetical protein